MKNKFSMIISIIFSIYINFKYLPYRTAKKLPLLFYWKTKVRFFNNSTITFDGPPNKFSFRFGISESFSLPTEKKNIFNIDASNLNISTKGITEIRRGSIISLRHANLTIGANLYANNNFYLESFKKVTIGNNNMFGYNVSIRDSDGHIYNNDASSSSSEIVIGDNIWIGAKSTILKGSNLKDGVVIGYSSLITKSSNNHEERDCLAGHPAKVIQKNITWSREQP